MTTALLPASDNFDVIMYRGANVVSRDGWIADAKSRGGVITRVPGGFFHDVEAARFGTAPPYVYELPPLWLMTALGLQYAVDEITQRTGVDQALSDAAQQLQPAADAINAGWEKLKSSLPLILAVLAIVIVAAVGFAIYKDLT